MAPMFFQKFTLNNRGLTPIDHKGELAKVQSGIVRELLELRGMMG